jgi:hypothetical protein
MLEWCRTRHCRVGLATQLGDVVVQKRLITTNKSPAGVSDDARGERDWFADLILMGMRHRPLPSRGCGTCWRRETRAIRFSCETLMPNHDAVSRLLAERRGRDDIGAERPNSIGIVVPSEIRLGVP